MTLLTFPGALDNHHEALHVVEDPTVGLTAVICVDSTRLGPADGGVRMRPYASLDDAVGDVTRLARAMTLKYALAGEPRGGGKAVIVGDPRADKTPELLRRFGTVVDRLGGAYWAGADAGIGADDLVHVHATTRYVSTLPVADGGSGDIGPFTAAGVLHGMRACLARATGRPDLSGRKVTVQGLGSCGLALVARLAAEGAQVVVADVDPDKVAAAQAAFGVVAVAPEEIFDVAADVCAPCALGGVIDSEVASRLDVAVVAGSANNVLADEATEALLVDRGITYAVDFVTNAGGAIADVHRADHGAGDRAGLDAKLAAIGPRVLEVLRRAERGGVLPSQAARSLAEARLARPDVA